MLNDIKVPPPPAVDEDPAHTPKAPGVRPHPHLTPNVDLKAPGLHHPRVMGEATKTDVIYAMPMEDRGSFFSTTLSVVVVSVFCVLLIVVWWTMFKG